jgi:tetratricopeptide (TPR) repeat protein
LAQGIAQGGADDECWNAAPFASSHSGALLPPTHRMIVCAIARDGTPRRTSLTTAIRGSRWRAPIILLCAAALFAAPSVTFAQRNEFTTQIVMVPPLRSPQRGMGVKAADIIRSRLNDAHSKRELRSVSKGDLNNFLEASSYRPDTALAPPEERAVSKHFRVDELVDGEVTRTASGIRVEAVLVLTRDRRLRQTITAGEGPNVDRAARAVADEMVEARKQLVPLRRCENAARDSKYAEAIDAARQGIAAFPKATLARACLVDALVRSAAPADSVLRASKELLALDATSAIGLERGAVAHDVVGNTAEAAALWSRLYETDTLNAVLAERILSALAGHGNAKTAAGLAERAVRAFPDSVALRRTVWLVELEAKLWKRAIKTGDTLAKLDSATTKDPRFFERMATALRADNQTERALLFAVRGVTEYPGDADLYVLYAQLVRGEAGVVVGRGQQRFPQSGQLAALGAQALREQGKLKESLEATQRALALDPSLSRGFLQLAQTFLDLDQPDSATAALERALAQGEDTVLVAQYALSRGNALYKSAGAAKNRVAFQQAARLLALASRVAPTPQSKFLHGASLLSVAQLAAIDTQTDSSCALVQLAGEALNTATAELTDGASVSPDVARQMLELADRLRPYLETRAKAPCS